MNVHLPISLLAATTALLAAAPASGQHHAAPKQQPPAASCTPAHAAMGHCTMPAPTPTAPKATACTAEHAAMGHCTMPSPPPPPVATCTPEHAAMGHCSLPAIEGPEGTDLPAGSGSAPSTPTDHAADAIYGAEAMAMGRHHLTMHHGGMSFSKVMLDMAEVRFRRGHEGYAWDGKAWLGGDINRFVVKSEGEGEFGEGTESAEVQALYSRAVDPYFNLQAGVRYDFEPSPSRVYATLGVEGLAPGFFDVEGTLFLSDRGELSARVEGHYDQRITQELILQPRVEFDLAAQDSRDIGVGAGLSKAEAGLRLRYDLAREFAPYIGVQYERAFGETARFRRDAGEPVGGWSLLAGIRAWF